MLPEILRDRYEVTLLCDITQMLHDERFYAMIAKYVITYTSELIPFIVQNVEVFYKNIEGRKSMLSVATPVFFSFLFFR